jgi:ELWxxDGT repeat protein
MRNSLRLSLLACLLLLSHSIPSWAQSAVLLRDVPGFSTPPAESSAPRQLVPLDGKVFFTAWGNGSGEEPWVSDGTTLGTWMLADVCPGSCGSEPTLLGAAGHTVLWLATEEPNGKARLWRSDGTRPGTYRLADEIVEVRKSDFHTNMQEAGGGAVYFVGCTEAQGCEPWRSDGTRQGTRRIADLAPGAESSSTGEFTFAAGKLFFYLWDGGLSLRASDGTAAGTVSLGKFRSIHHFTAAGSRLFFFGGTGDDDELWTSDGTVAGTRQVSHFHTAKPFVSFDYYRPQTAGDRIYFQASEDNQGVELWRGDGSGVARMTDLVPSSPFPVTRADLLEETGASRIAFLARKDDESDSGVFLYGNAGPGSSSVLLMPVCSGYCDYNPDKNLGMARAGSRAVFRVGDDRDEGSLWSTDGTSAGTVRLTAPAVKVATRPVSGDGGLAYFWVSAGDESELWRTDGTSTGTRPIAWSSGNLPYQGLPELVAVGAKVFFAVENSALGLELWTGDGTREGSHLVLDLRRSAPSSNPQDLAALGDRMFFSACGIWWSSGTPETTERVLVDDYCSSESERGLTAAGGLIFFLKGIGFPQLWRTDGTAAGTFQLTPEGVETSGLAAFKGKLFFIAHRPGFRPEIWSSDGTVAGTGKAFDLPQPIDLQAPLYAFGPFLYFQGYQEADGTRLWISDGTTTGTRPILETRIAGLLTHFVSLGGSTYFLGDGLLLKSDGTAAGTGVVQLSPDNSIYDFQDLTLFHGALYFTAGLPGGRALFKSDGTPGGTSPVRQFKDHDYGLGHHLTVFQDRLFFTMDDDEHGSEPWRSDGTPEGTVLLKDVEPGPAGSHPDGFTPAGDRLYFAAGENAHGRELWKTDGTAAGTELAQDLSPLGDSSSPQQLAVAGGHLFFSADDGLWGRELWALPLGAAAATCQPSDTSLCLSGQRFRVEARWQDFSGNSGAGHAVSLTSDTGYFWFFDPKNVETILKVLDGQGINGHFWVFYGGLSNLDYELTVTDTRTGLERRYYNLPGRFASVGDTQGFGPLGAYKSRTVAAPSPPPVISERLDAAAATGTCVPGPNRLCLNDGRFSVQAAWKDFSGHSGAGNAVGLTGDTGYFWFFDAANVEVVLKVLDGRPVNGKFWVYYGALSNVEYTLTVTDTVTGKVKTYANPPGRFASAGDSSAF